MSQLTLDISMSVDGFVAGPNQTLEQPLGEGGEQLHEWAFATKAFRERHGLDGGATDRDSPLITLERYSAAAWLRRRCGQQK